MDNFTRFDCSADLLEELGLGPLMDDPKAFVTAKMRLLAHAASYPCLTPTACRLLMYLVTAIRPRPGFCYPRKATIAARLGTSQQAVTTASRQLQALDLIFVDRQSSKNGTNRYILNLHPFAP